MEAEYKTHVPVIVFRLIIFTLGMVGNIIVITAVLLTRDFKKTVTYWYVLQLAIADSLFLLSIPFKAKENLDNRWRFSNGTCKAIEGILFINLYCSILFLMIMSFDRYITVCKSRTIFRQLRSVRGSRVITAVVWILSILLSIPILSFSAITGEESRCRCNYVFPFSSLEEYCTVDLGYTGDLVKNCTESFQLPQPVCTEVVTNNSSTDSEEDLFEYFGSGFHEFYYNEAGNQTAAASTDNSSCSYVKHPIGLKVFITFNFFVMFLIPVLVMAACYLPIIVEVERSRFRRKGRPTPHGKRKTLDRTMLRLTLLCSTLVVSFIVFWLPFHVVHLAKINGISGSNEHCDYLVEVTLTLGYSNSAVNPFVYNFFGANFRQRLRSAAGTIRTSVRASERHNSSNRIEASRGRSHSMKFKKRSSRVEAVDTFTSNETRGIVKNSDKNDDCDAGKVTMGNIE